MDNRKDEMYYLDRILGDLNFVLQHMDNVTYEDFCSDEVLQDSMMFRLIQVSENAASLSDEYKGAHDDIPWTAINGLRNRIVHDYGNVDLGIVYRTLENDIPVLLKQLEEVRD